MSSAASHSSDHDREDKHKEASQVDVTEYEAKIRANAPLLRGRKLTAALAFVAGTGFTLFGCVVRLQSRGWRQET